MKIRLQPAVEHYSRVLDHYHYRFVEPIWQPFDIRRLWGFLE